MGSTGDASPNGASDAVKTPDAARNGTYGRAAAPNIYGLDDDGYYDLGALHRPVTTSRPEAQRWFDRGLTLAYAFNMGEAADCFHKAREADPDLLIARWGQAFTLGPYYNKAWKMFEPADLHIALQTTYSVLQEALHHPTFASISPVEQALIRAIAVRCPQPTPPPSIADYDGWSLAYAEAMQQVYEQFPDDIDIAVLCADAHMNLTPWELWAADGSPAPRAHPREAQAALEHALTLPGADVHPGLLHTHIHLMEMSLDPEAAIESADRLRHLVPDNGHLCHMPSHIDVVVGNYTGAIAANALAQVGDELYASTVLRQAGAAAAAGDLASSKAMIRRIQDLLGYAAHNIHSLIFAAMLNGNSKAALERCDHLEALLPEEEVLRVPQPPLANWLETFWSVRPHILIRFGRWDDILALQLPDDPVLFSVTTTTIYYARAITYAATGRVAEAEAEQKLFRAAAAKVPPERIDFPNRCIDIFEVAEAMLAGELAYRKGDYDEAFKLLRAAVKLDDNLVYSEPWPWMMPTRHALAALLLEQGHVEESLVVYAEDLGPTVKNIPPASSKSTVQHVRRGHQHPNNIWALHGYRECLTLLGRQAEAAELDEAMEKAVREADVAITASCFCRTNGDVDPLAGPAKENGQSGSAAGGHCCSRC